MFIGRENELSKLNRMYKSDKFEMAIIYGRRRVGKTTLINEFCKDKDTVFFPAIESNAEQNLEILSGAISYLQNGESNAEFKYKSFADAIAEIIALYVAGSLSSCFKRFDGSSYSIAFLSNKLSSKFSLIVRFGENSSRYKGTPPVIPYIIAFSSFV
jgi:AAA+ ATPase superfamily predicted ATPase